MEPVAPVRLALSVTAGREMGLQWEHVWKDTAAER